MVPLGFGRPLSLRDRPPKATDERVSVGLLSDRVRRRPCDKAASFPKLCIAAIHGLLHLLDGIFVVSALDIFSAPKVIGATNDVRAICGYSVPLSQAGVLPDSQSPTPGQSRSR